MHKLLKLQISLYKDREFSSFVPADFPKQKQALELLTDDTTRYLLYGGAAGGGKSYTGWLWLIMNCLAYPETTWFFSREELNDARKNGALTFAEVCKNLAIPHGIFKYNGQDNYYLCQPTGSIIYMIEVKPRPSDKDYHSLGSTLYTGGFMEEAGQHATGDAFDVLKTRVGRYKNDEYNLLPKIFLTANPSRNFLYKTFYYPYTENSLPGGYAFIKALVQDNPLRPKEYEENLQNISDPLRRARLLHGDWDFDLSANRLFDFHAVMDIFRNEHVPAGEKYITIDAARMGSDKAVIIRWEGFRAPEIITFDKSRTTDIAAAARELATRHSIRMSNVVCDEDGVGGGVVDILHCEGFLNNSSAREIKGARENYPNLKTQCYYRLAERINAGGLYIAPGPYEHEITEELDAIRRDKMDADGKLHLLKKEDIRRSLGRSPDYADALMMREYFGLRPKGGMVMGFV